MKNIITLSLFSSLAVIVMSPLLFVGPARTAVPTQTVNTCTPDQILSCVNGTVNSVNNNVTTYGYGAVLFANLPTCAAGNVGQRSIISNGAAAPVWNAAAASGAAVYTPVLCAQTGAATFAWVNS